MTQKINGAEESLPKSKVQSSAPTVEKAVSTIRNYLRMTKPVLAEKLGVEEKLITELESGKPVHAKKVTKFLEKVGFWLREKEPAPVSDFFLLEKELTAIQGIFTDLKSGKLREASEELEIRSAEILNRISGEHGFKNFLLKKVFLREFEILALSKLKTSGING